MWRIAPAGVKEAHATAVFASLTNNQQKALAALKPTGSPIAKFEMKKDGNFDFEVLIPWEVFPPADRTHLEFLSLSVDFIRADQAPKNSVPRPMRRVAVSPPIVTRLTPCEQPLVGRDANGTDQPGFYLLTRNLDVREVLFFENSTYFMSPVTPTQEDVSPLIRREELFVQRLSPGEFLCGPSVAYMKAGRIQRFPFELGAGRRHASLKPLKPSVPKSLPDGNWLVKFGPEIAYSINAHAGACAPVWFQVFFISDTGDLTQSFTYAKCLETPEATIWDIQTDRDWRTITEFVATASGLQSQTFCLVGRAYKPCGKNPHAQPPKHRVLIVD